MKNDLIERYIYAVTKKMPNELREDVSAEINTLIMDMLEERCGESKPAEDDIHAVLNELGTPSELYEKYSQDSKRCLIGAPHYDIYKLVLKIVLICTAFGMVVAEVVSKIADPAQFGYVEILKGFSMILSGMLNAFAFITLIFAIFYHKDIKIEMPTRLDDLPPVPKKEEIISRQESVFGIAISAVFVVIFLLTPQVSCMVMPDTKELVPIFDTNIIKDTWYFIIAFGAMGIIKGIIKLIDGCFTNRVLITTIAANTVTIILTALWLLNYELVNPKFIAGITKIFNGEFIISVINNVQYIFLACILVALILDTITTIIKRFRYNRT